MVSDGVERVEASLDRALAALPTPARLLAPHDHLGDGLTVRRALDLWVDAVTSRQLDVAARRLKADGRGHYTISSAGHERTVLVGALTRVTDPALLHYRDGAFVVARHRVGGRRDVVEATLRSLVADRREPASGGRHKVWGSAPLGILPQTSTIASHVPKATGLALAVDRAARLGIDGAFPHDAVVVASIGDASCNHASALAGINAAAWSRRRGVGVPLLLVVEDNGLGISTPSPAGWVRQWTARWPHVAHAAVPDDLVAAWRTVRDAVRRVRGQRRPMILHLPTVRLWGHAGSDVEAAYRTPGEIRDDEARDPLVGMARQLVAAGAAGGPRLGEVLATVRDEVAATIDRLDPIEPLPDRRAVVASLVAHDDNRVRRTAADLVPRGARRKALFDGQPPRAVTTPARRTLAAWTNATLREVLASVDGSVVIGQDVGRKGGVYGVTAGLQARFGAHRVIDALLDETSILGAAQGAALAGQLAVAEIQYLAYVHNAIDQLRGEAASTRFLSGGAQGMPLVVRTASFADPHGFGGHFHNDHAVAALREIPGVAIAVPSRGDVAVGLLRAAVAMALTHGRPVVVLEPTALYHRRDLHEPGDDAWTSAWPGDDALALPGTVGLEGPEDAEVLLVTAGNGVALCHRVAARAGAAGTTVRVLDLRWLAPLPHGAVLAAARRAGRVVVVDECRASGGWADAVVAGLVRGGFAGPVVAVTAADSYVPIGPAAVTVLVDEDEVAAAVDEVTAG